MTELVIPLLRRFWSRRETPHVDDGMGYLADLEEGTRTCWSGAAEAVTAERFQNERCVVLLGSPGAGKTTWLRLHGRTLLPEPGTALVELDLASCSSDGWFDRHVVNDARILKWIDGEGHLCLVLDAFDEALLRVDTLPGLLTDTLRQWPMERLWLRITGRTVVWPASAEDELAAAFGRRPTVWRLLPLRQRDVDDVARVNGINAEEFRAAVSRSGAGALASTPVTLRMLLGIYGKTGAGLPTRAAEVYEMGLTGLCEEVHRRRRGASTPRMPLRDVMTCAEAIAAAARFGGRSAMWTGPLHETPADCVAIEDCLDVAPSGTPLHARTTFSGLREALRTALFEDAGVERISWAHTTFEEALAARWMISADLTKQQVDALLFADDGLLHLPLVRVAAWAVAIDPERFGHLATADPSALAGQLDIPDDDLAARVVDALFVAADNGRLRRDRATDHSKLLHPGLVGQARGRLRSGSTAGRRLAIDITSSCKLAVLAPDLVAVCFDTDSPTPLRTAAALALMDSGVANDSLVPLLDLPPAPDDPWDELRGAALLASWPGALTTARALAVIEATPLPATRFLGLFSTAVDKVARTIGDDDVAAVSSWLQRLDHASTEEDNARSFLRDAALRLCAAHLDDASARAAAVHTCLLQLHAWRQVVGPSLDAGYEPLPNRRRLAIAIARTDPSPLVRSQLIGAASVGCLLQTSDLVWLEKARPDADALDGAAIDRLITAIRGPGSAAATATRPPVVVGPVHLPPPVSDQTLTAIADAVARAERGDAGFTQASLLVSGRDADVGSLGAYGADLTTRPRWRHLGREVQQRLVRAAARVVAEPDDLGSSVPGGTSRSPRLTEQDRFRALVLLLREDPYLFHGLPPASWRTAARPLVAWPVMIGGPSVDDKHALLPLAREHAGEELRSAVLDVVDRAIQKGATPLLDVEVELLWDDKLAAELEVRLHDDVLPLARDRVAELLLRHDPDRVRQLLASWVAPDGIAADRLRAVAAVRLMLGRDPSASWASIDELMTSDSSLLREAVAGLGEPGRRPSLALPADALADLYLWLHQQAASSADAAPLPRPFTADDALGDWRTQIVIYLRDAGSTAAVDALTRLRDAVPEQPWLRGEVLLAEEARRRISWRAISPETLGRLAANGRTRLVNSSKDLAALVIEALAEVQERLTGSVPESHLLWDSRCSRPKPEDDASDYLRNRLHDLLVTRGVVVNREVQVRRTSKRGVGERVDLFVQASSAASSSSVFRVIIEVKAAWHTDLMKAMHEQLVDRYLVDEPGAHGVYLAVWPDVDSRGDGGAADKQLVARRDRSGARAELLAQAKRLQEAGRAVAAVNLEIPYARLPR